MAKNLPEAYKWLLTIGTLPKMVQAFLDHYGTQEVAGPRNNDKIMKWAEELKLKAYTADSIPWCGLLMAKVAKDAGKPVVDGPLWALNWSKFSKNRVKTPKLGDVLTFKRPGGGHVGLYIAEDETHYHVGGGNQSDDTNIIRIAKNRLYSACRPHYNNEPATVQQYFVSPKGAPVSTNEA
jgi:uncharacterized protein (TIGR02594 family)